MNYSNQPSPEDYTQIKSQQPQDNEEQSLEAELKPEALLPEPLPDSLNPLKDFLEPNHVGGEQER